MPKNKKMLGANQSRPAKAGKRKAPINKGDHVTTAEMRNEGRYYSKFGLKPTHLRRQNGESIISRNKRVKDFFEKDWWEPYNWPEATYDDVKSWTARNETAEHTRLMKKKKELLSA